jgi:hypothetical protein
MLRRRWTRRRVCMTVEWGCEGGDEWEMTLKWRRGSAVAILQSSRLPTAGLCSGNAAMNRRSLRSSKEWGIWDSVSAVF